MHLCAYVAIARFDNSYAKQPARNLLFRRDSRPCSSRARECRLFSRTSSYQRSEFRYQRRRAKADTLAVISADKTTIQSARKHITLLENIRGRGLSSRHASSHLEDNRKSRGRKSTVDNKRKCMNG